MQTYTYTTLTEDVQHNIREARYSKQELEDIYKGLKEKAKTGRRKMKRLRIILAVVYLFMILPSFKSVMDIGDTSILLGIVSILFPLPFLALGYILARWHSYGMFCWQFNKAVQKGYPQYAEEYRL